MGAGRAEAGGDLRRAVGGGLRRAPGPPEPAGRRSQAPLLRGTGRRHLRAGGGSPAYGRVRPTGTSPTHGGVRPTGRDRSAGPEPGPRDRRRPVGSADELRAGADPGSVPSPGTGTVLRERSPSHGIGRRPRGTAAPVNSAVPSGRCGWPGEPDRRRPEGPAGRSGRVPPPDPRAAPCPDSRRNRHGQDSPTVPSGPSGPSEPPGPSGPPGPSANARTARRRRPGLVRAPAPGATAPSRCPKPSPGAAARGRPPGCGRRARCGRVVRAAGGTGGAARTGGRQPIALSIDSVAAFHALSGAVPRCSMLLICVEIMSLIAASFGPSTASGMALASSA